MHMLGGYIANCHDVEPFSKREQWFLVLLTILGGTIRILYQYNRPFVGDEIGTLIYMGKSISYLLSHFESWLTMNYFIVLEKFMRSWAGDSQISLCFVPLLAGTAIIPLTAILARQLTSTRIALFAAVLVAGNPYLISFSVIIRSYSLLTALSLLVLILFFRWYSNPTYKGGSHVAIACYILTLSHLNGAYIVFYVVFMAVADWMFDKNGLDRKMLMTLLMPMVVSGVVAAVSHAQIYPDILKWGVQWHDDAPTDIGYLTYAFSEYFGKGYYSWTSLALFFTAVFAAYKRDFPVIVLLPAIVLPILLVSIQGISHFPWGHARFLIFTVPVFIIFISYGIYLYSSNYSKCNIIGVIVLILVLVTWAPGVVHLYSKKSAFPWTKIADFIDSRYSANDVILYNNRNVSHNLLPYFSDTKYAKFQVSDFSPDNEKCHGSLFLVSAKPYIISDYPTYKYGDLQVTIYDGHMLKQAYLKMREDLLGSIKPGEVSADYVDHYRTIWKIGQKLNIEDHYVYHKLYLLCLQLTRRQREMPMKLLHMRSEQIAKE